MCFGNVPHIVFRMCCTCLGNVCKCFETVCACFGTVSGNVLKCRCHSCRDCFGWVPSFGIVWDVCNLFGNCACQVIQMRGGCFEHVLETFGDVFERVCKYFRVWGGDAPCKNQFSLDFCAIL